MSASDESTDMPKDPNDQAHGMVSGEIPEQGFTSCLSETLCAGTPGEGASPGPHDCTPEKRGARGNEAQAGRSLAPPSPCLCRRGARCMDCMERDGLTREGALA